MQYLWLEKAHAAHAKWRHLQQLRSGQTADLPQGTFGRYLILASSPHEVIRAAFLFFSSKLTGLYNIMIKEYDFLCLSHSDLDLSRRTIASEKVPRKIEIDIEMSTLKDGVIGGGTPSPGPVHHGAYSFRDMSGSTPRPPERRQGLPGQCLSTQGASNIDARFAARTVQFTQPRGT